MYHLILFQTIEHTKAEADHRNKVSEMVMSRMGIHDIGRELGKTGITDDRHDEKSRPALRIIAKIRQRQ